MGNLFRISTNKFGKGLNMLVIIIIVFIIVALI